MEYFLSLVGFAVAAAGTPGPNNLMVMASGANYGYWRTIPHILGIAIGYPVMILALGLGIGGLFARYPILHTVLTVLMLVYLGWLAWRIATAGEPTRDTRGGRPLTFFQAAAFQWVNPKGWALGLGAITFYAAEAANPTLQSAVVALVFALIVPICVSVWCLFGLGIARYLANPTHRRIFNLAMAALLVVSVIPALL